MSLRMTYLFSIACIFLYYFFSRLFRGKTKAEGRIEIWQGKDRKVFFFLSAIHLLCVHAFTDHLSFPDNVNYYYAFRDILSYSFKEAAFTLTYYSKWGQGFVLLNYILSRISEDPQILFVACSCLFVPVVMWFLYKTAHYPLFSVCVFVLYPMMFFQSQYVLRQHLASAFLLIALYFINRDARKALFVSVAAFLIHPSAIAFFPFFLWNRIDLSNKIAARSALFYGSFFIVAARLLIGKILSFFPRFDYDNTGATNIVPLVLLVSLFLIHFFSGSYKKQYGNTTKTILNYLSYGAVVAIFSLGLPGGGRLCNYFIYVLPVAVPLLLKNKKMSMIKFLYMGGFMLIAIIMLRTNILLYS